MPYFYISVKEQRVRDLIDQLPDDQHKLDMFVEIAESYDMSHLTTQSFKTLNTNALANSIDAIKDTKKKVSYEHVVDWVINLVNSQLKRQGVKFVKRLVTMLKFVEANIKRKTK